MRYETDVLVAGTGAAGLCAALIARRAGLRVVVTESTGEVGGTTAYSEGMAWMPGNVHAQRAGVADSPDAVFEYLKAIAGNHFMPEHARAFIAGASLAIDDLEQAGVHFWHAGSADYRPDLPGASAGRALYPMEFDLRQLGRRWAAALRPPLPATTILGGMPIPSRHFEAFYRMLRSPSALTTVGTLVARYWSERSLGWRNGRVIPGGRALVAALLHAFINQGGSVHLHAGLASLIPGPNNGWTARLANADEVVAHRAVILAGGGFSSGDTLSHVNFPPEWHDARRHRLCAPGAVGSTVEVALGLGGWLRQDLGHAAAWAPTSFAPGKGVFPHFVERAKPGFIAVDADGRRFTNEADTYQLFGERMLRDAGGRAWLIGDERAVRRWGLGAVGPRPVSHRPYLKSGYLTKAHDVTSLARRIDVDEETLRHTLDRVNGFAAEGLDPDFEKGYSPHNRNYGEASLSPNPCVRPLRPPFYAVALGLGDLGSFIGLATSPDGEVLLKSGLPIPGLFAVGNDMASPFGGPYPAPGATIGPALTFGWRAARRVADNRPQPESAV